MQEAIQFHRVKRANENARVEFVFTTLKVGFTACRLARTQREFGYDPTNAIQQAEAALAVVSHSIRRLQHREESEQVIAQADGLRVELDALKNTENLPYTVRLHWSTVVSSAT